MWIEMIKSYPFQSSTQRSMVSRNFKLTKSLMKLRNIRRKLEVVFAGCQTTYYREEFSYTDIKESGIYNDHELYGLNSLYNLGTDLVDLEL